MPFDLSSVTEISIPQGDVSAIAVNGTTIWTAETKPYSAEVEYLESTGTQYIDSGYAFSENFSWEISCSALGPYTTVFGGRTSSARSSLLFCSSAGKTVVNIGSMNANTTPFQLGTLTGDHVYKGSFASNKGTILLDGVTKFSNRAFYGTYISRVTQGIFADNYGTYWDEFASVKLYYLKMWQGSTLVRDFIPVRVGSGANAVGYLYDRANPTGGPSGNGLYGNNGTGSFIIGSDKTT